MDKQRKISFRETRLQLSRIQRLYSAIGEPLPVDVIFDLCRHLPTVLSAAKPAKGKARKMRS